MIGAIMAKRMARSQFALLNARDLAGYMEAIAEDVTFEFPGHVPGSGTHVGKPALRRFFETMFELHPESHFTLRHVAVDGIWSVNATNTVLVEWDLDYTDQAGRWFHNSGVTSGSALGGKIVRIKDFVFDWDVLADANALASESGDGVDQDADGSGGGAGAGRGTSVVEVPVASAGPPG